MITVETIEGGAETLSKLGVSLDHGIYLAPLNLFREEDTKALYYPDSKKTISKVFRKAKLEVNLIDAGNLKRKYLQQNSIEWLGPVLIFTYQALQSNPHITSIALGVVANYLTDLFKGRSSGVNIKMSAVLEQTTDRKYAEFKYEGTPEGLEEFGRMINTYSDGKELK